MAAPTRVTSGSTILINDLNQLIDLFEGAASMTEAFKFVSSAGENFIVKLSDAAGARKFSIQDSAGSEVASINSDGALVISGGFTPSGSLILPASTSPATTTDAAIQWDSDDNRIVVGDGSSVQTFYPGTIQYKFRTATLNLTTATYADVAATSGNIAFTAVTGKTYLIKLRVVVTAVGNAGTDGLKLAFTHPTVSLADYIGSYSGFRTLSPDAGGYVGNGAEEGAALTINDMERQSLYSVNTTSGASFFGVNAGTASTGSNTAAVTGIAPGLFEVECIMTMTGSGTVTLQAACQTDGAGTSTISGIHMTVQEIISA